MTPRALALSLSLLLAACGGGDAPMDGIGVVTPDPATPSVPVLVGAVIVDGAGQGRVGERYPMRAVVKGTNGQILDRAVTWRVDDPRIASIDVDGVVTVRDTGTTRIRAETGGMAGVLSLTGYDWDLRIEGTALLMADAPVLGANGVPVTPWLTIACTVSGSLMMHVGLDGLAFSGNRVTYRVGDRPAVSEPWGDWDDTHQRLFLPLAGAEAWSWVHQLAAVNTFTMSFVTASGARTATWRVGGLAERLPQFTEGCR